MVKPVWEIDGITANYLAASLGTPDETVRRLRDGLARIKSDGTFAAIQWKWSE